MEPHKYARINEAPIYEQVVNGKGKKVVNKILMGTYVTLLDQNAAWYRVKTAGPDGWMHADTLTDEMGLKLFFVDVGQGDCMLLEAGNYKILIDAGPNNNMHGYLTKWQYTYLLKAGENIHIDFLIITHFDTDHYKGFIKMINNKKFTIGTIVHPGILKYAAKENPYDTVLGNKVKFDKVSYLLNKFDDLLNIKDKQPFNRDITSFLKSIKDAHTEGRLQKTKRYEQGQRILNKKTEGKTFIIDVLAPYTEKYNNRKVFAYWGDESHTINGNSIVLKITFGDRTIFIGGDLNKSSQEYLMKKYGNVNPFESDVAKSSHHGSSDFSEAFLQQINPYATIISSGDNESYSHPRADAIGCSGKYSRSSRPLVYAIELSRSVDLKNKKILFGMINLRCNGKDIYISQMREVKNNINLWDAYEVK